MKIKLNLTPRCQVELDVTSPKDAIKELSAYGEILADTKCGMCKSEAIRHEHRVSSEGHDFFGMRCLACGAQLNFGQHKTGQTLFAKRDQGENGWYQYRRDSQ